MTEWALQGKIDFVDGGGDEFKIDIKYRNSIHPLLVLGFPLQWTRNDQTNQLAIHEYINFISFSHSLIPFRRFHTQNKKNSKKTKNKINI